MNVSAKVRQKIQRMPVGRPFLSSQFLEIGRRTAVDQALSRLVKAGGIVRMRRGIFVKPKKNRYAGEILPGPEVVAEVLAKASGWKFQIHGAEAARRFGLSTQTPVRTIFYTNGPSRHVRIGNLAAELKRVSQRKLVLAGRPAGEALSALWYLGKEGVTPEVFERIRTQLPPEEFTALLGKKAVMPAWLSEATSRYEKERCVA